ncbi:asparagine--tRNA ligase [Pyrus ussuriensis x Pyrus communis]|uniref:Asparagine--tRNA ligase n=1 Tax=Pyrus ussuriensis x Pyrus communis TaxID=2448454 RepID=A0A5N5HT32_9ROSA|nr:asparagine--tRNA ligase [Pyrus ussuriensis x Pyrus communis]
MWIVDWGKVKGRAIEEMVLPAEPYEWHIDLTRFGTIKHCGFGLGFERMVLFATGIDHIRYARRTDL